MRMNDVRRMVEEGYLRFLQPEGYKLDGRGGGDGVFTSKHHPQQERTFYYGITNYEPEYWLQPQFGLGILPIELIWRQFAGLVGIPPKAAKNGKTIGSLIGCFWGDVNFVHQNLRTPEDVQQALQRVEADYSKWVKPLMDEVATVEAYDRLVNTRPEERFFYVEESSGKRCFRSIIAARLTKNPRYDDLEAYYRQFLHRFEDAPMYVSAFDQLTAHLKVTHPF